MEKSNSPEPNWYTVAHQILVQCRDLAERVTDEGVKLMLTDTDKAVLQGFRIVSERASSGELQALCVAAQLDQTYLEAMQRLAAHYPPNFFENPN